MARRRRTLETLTFEHYASNIEDFVFYPNCGERDAAALAYCSIALAGEVGEVSDQIKKALRDEGLGRQDRRLEPDRRRAIGLELGDAMFYLFRLCEEVGYSPADVARMNLNKLDTRMEILASEGHAAAKKTLRKRRLRKARK